MIQLHDSIIISRQPGEVFAFIADLNNIPKWQSEVVSTKVITGGSTKVGTRFTEIVKMGPRRVIAQCEITEFLPDRIMSFKTASSSIEYQGRVLLEPSQNGTQITIEGTVHPKGFWKILQPFMKSEFRNGVKKELTALKENLENA